MTCATCGHPKDAHGPQQYPKGQEGCKATVHVTTAHSRPTIAYSYPCPCKAFQARAA